MEAIAAPKSVPVTMLSGFLGAGANPDQHSYRCGHTSAAKRRTGRVARILDPSRGR